MGDYPGQIEQVPAYMAPVAVVPTISVIQPAFGALQFGSQPVRMTCPHCRMNITTRTRSSPGFSSWIIALVLCLAGCWCCCCCPLCCCTDLHNITHECPNCNSELGMRKGA